MTWRDRVALGPLASRIRDRLRLRKLAGTAIGLGALGLLAIMGEASLRARLSPPESRVPTTIYTRPTGWGEDRGRVRAVAIGSALPQLAEARVPVKLDEIPERLVEAVLAIEDQRFHQHSGLDLKRIAGAAVANLRARRIVQGGSTLTQQLAKNLFLGAERTPLRKIREAAMAVVLEHEYDKATILEAYLNEIYLGQDGRRAIHGVGAASRYYFDKDVNDLSLSEAALLAGMISAPNRYTPVRHPKTARARRDLVLGLMVEQERASSRNAERAARERIRSRPAESEVIDARYFRDLVGDRLRGLATRGARVYSTLDARLQRAAVRAVREGPGIGKAQAALVAIDPATGDVLAMVGGRDYAASQFNRATDARRQPGSAFKPIVALAALGRTRRGAAPAFTLASVVPDEPLRVATPAGQWEPRNYDREFRGPVTLRDAMEQSLNVPFARIGLEVGPERVVETARRLGITSRLRAVPSIALGSSEVTLMELTRAFGVLAASGELAQTRMLLAEVRVGDGEPDMEQPRTEHVVDPAEAYLVTSALEGVVARGTGYGLGRWAGRGGIAAKSGTSNDWRDGWFIAYSSAIVVGVWVGHDDGRSLRMTGAQAALPIVSRFLDVAFSVEEPERFRMPDGIEVARVATSDADWMGWGCATRREVFLEGTAPEERCDDESPRWQIEIGSDRLATLERRAEELAERLIERFQERVRRHRHR